MNQAGAKPYQRKGNRISVGLLDSGLATPIENNPSVGQVTFAYFDQDGYRLPARKLQDETGHGTAMAGALLVAATEPRPSLPPAAIDLVCGAVTESGLRRCRILAGLLWMADQPIDMLNLSIGRPGYDPVFEPAINLLTQRGVLVVASIGNGGAGSHCSPGDYESVLSVGATNQGNEIAAYSGSQSLGLMCRKPDLLAEGFSSSTPEASRSDEFLTGTSIATAIMSGLAARLMTAVPEASARGVMAALKKAGLPIHHTKAHRAVRGGVQTKKAVRWLIGHPNPPAKALNAVPFQRDEVLASSFAYSEPDRRFRVILYAAPGHYERVVAWLEAGQKQDELRQPAAWSTAGYAVVTATKQWLLNVWEDERIRMISLAD